MVEPGNPQFPEDFPAHDDSSLEESAVEFYFEDTEFVLHDPPRLRQWIQDVIARESGILHALSFIFCSDGYLHQLNVEYLDHDTLTDVITFPYLDPPNVEGDIFISADRVRDNAAELGITFDRELRRVMIHGVLHLCGYSDKTPEEKEIMTQREDEALALLD